MSNNDDLRAIVEEMRESADFMRSEHADLDPHKVAAALDEWASRIADAQGTVGDTRERLAGYAHAAWSGWMRHLFNLSIMDTGGACMIPPGLVQRWQRQMTTDYSDLPDEEKESDRKEADRMLAIIGALAKGEEQSSLYNELHAMRAELQGAAWDLREI